MPFSPRAASQDSESSCGLKIALQGLTCPQVIPTVGLGKVPELGGADGCTTCEDIYCHGAGHLKIIKMINFVMFLLPQEKKL